MIQKQRNIKIKLFIAVLFLSIGFLPQIIKETKAQTDFNVRGWSWSGNYGWVSLFCDPDESNPQGWSCGSGSNPALDSYGVAINPVSGIISGFAWSSNVGWISFDYTENTNNETEQPPYNPADPDNYLDPQGYDPMQDTGSPGSPCNDSTPCTAWFDRNTTFTFEGETYGIIKGWGRILSLRDDNNSNTSGWVRMSGKWGPGPLDIYGVGISFALEETGENELAGSNWNGFGWSMDAGMGFLDFNPTCKEGDCIDEEFGGVAYKAPFLETLSGDIYSKEGVGTVETFSPPAGFYSATYLIQSGGDIINFCTTAGEIENPDLIYCGDVGQDSDTEFLNLGEAAYPDPFSPPLAFNRYTNVMGKLDVVGITKSYDTGIPGDPSDDENKFGNVLAIIPIGDKTSSDIFNCPGANDCNVALENKVYHVQGNLTIDDVLIIQNDQGVNPNASGTIVVDGNLLIDNNITYQGTPPGPGYNDIKEIPSVAWIVKGEVYVASTVENVVGAFIVVGKDTDGDGDFDDDDAAGNFHTGGGDVQLNIAGLVITYEIFLERSYTAPLPVVAPSEKITYDGRMIVNTPPGLFDFAQALPVIREVAPIEATP